MKRNRLLLCLAALVAWTAFIFCRSLQPADISTTESQWALDILRRLLPFELTMHTVRKLAHFTEFAVLGVLAGILFGGRCRRQMFGLLFSAMTGVVTALCDETLQLFVPGRTGQVQDVWLDIAGASSGAALALLIRWIVRKVRA